MHTVCHNGYGVRGALLGLDFRGGERGNNSSHEGHHRGHYGYKTGVFLVMINNVPGGEMIDPRCVKARPRKEGKRGASGPNRTDQLPATRQKPPPAKYVVKRNRAGHN